MNNIHSYAGFYNDASLVGEPDMMICVSCKIPDLNEGCDLCLQLLETIWANHVSS